MISCTWEWGAFISAGVVSVTDGKSGKESFVEFKANRLGSMLDFSVAVQTTILLLDVGGIFGC